MQKHQDYPKSPTKARFTLCATNGGQRVIMRGATMEDVLQRLRALCPGGKLREIWEARA